MNIEEVRKWLVSLNLGFSRVLTTPITTEEKIMTISRGVSRSKVKGISPSSYDRLAINCIVRWNKLPSESDIQIQKLIGEFYQIEPSIIIGGSSLVELIMRNVVSLGFGANEVYEYAFDFEIIYKAQERKEE